MVYTKSKTSKKEICPRCNNEISIKETVDPDNRTLICLHCGYYRTNSISFFMHLRDVNEFRKVLGLKPISELIDVNRYG